MSFAADGKVVALAQPSDIPMSSKHKRTRAADNSLQSRWLEYLNFVF
jgi:hypothetical protein